MMSKTRFYIAGLLLIAAGILAASGFIVSKKPDAKRLLDKLAPYQGIIGVIILVWGIYDLFYLLTHLKEFAAIRKIASIPGIPSGWAIKLWVYCYYFSGVVSILLGFLLGFGLIAAKAGAKSPDMAAKGEAMQKKLVGIQVPLGFVGAILGLLLIVAMVSIKG